MKAGGSLCPDAWWEVVPPVVEDEAGRESEGREGEFERGVGSVWRGTVVVAVDAVCRRGEARAGESWF